MSRCRGPRTRRPPPEGRSCWLRSNIEVRIGDGYKGWPEAAPFDSIVVTAASAEIPKPLIEQLRPGGRMVIPAGGSYDRQDLLLVEKQPDGTSTTKRTLPVRFVPLMRHRGTK
jgi:protein-L-isoaspartate(D-aspartate) O-methyltransferase